MTYWYCSVKLKGIDQTYSYISDFGKLESFTYVEVPFGISNISRFGIVESCNAYADGETPFPVKSTKHIRRIATQEEYASQHAFRPHDFYDYDDMEQILYYIEQQEWDEVLEWAIDHHDSDEAGVIQKVIECYRLCAEQNMPEAALNLGTFYYKGQGVEQDFAEAFRLYRIAADAGECRAICNLGYCYYYGRGCTVDYGQAYHYFSMGALIFNDANCLYKLGDLYLNGYYVKENRQFAFLFYQRALAEAESVSDPCLADVQFRMGKCLLHGIGTLRRTESAYTYLCNALIGFCRRKADDPFVGKLICSVKDYIRLAEEILENPY